MGYYTDYTLTADKKLPEDFNEKFEEITDYCFNFGEIFEAKWYNHEKDMIELSKIYPNILFTLEGVGEEQYADEPDMWRMYFKNGESKRITPVLSWPEVNLSTFGNKKYI